LQVDGRELAEIACVAEAGEELHSIGVALELEGYLEVVLVVRGVCGWP
jgi:hypothetical protein